MHDIQRSAALEEHVEIWVVCCLGWYSGGGILMLIDHDLLSHLDHVRHHSLLYMRVDRCDEAAEPIAVDTLV